MLRISRCTKPIVEIAAPPSKAHTLRSLFMSALADGKSEIDNPLLGQDQQRAIECLGALGVAIENHGDKLLVNGAGGAFEPVTEELFVGDSGVGMNFLTAITCLSNKPLMITGTERIQQRPIAEIVSGMRQLGCKIDYINQEGFPPIRVNGGRIPGGTAEIKGDISSQYFSAILTAAPYAEDPIELRCIGELSEKPYLDITIEMMSKFGVDIERQEYKSFRVDGSQKYKTQNIEIEGDYSSTSYFFEAAAVCNNRVIISGLNPDSVQGDRAIADLFQEMGCRIDNSTDITEVIGGPLTAIEADMSDTPDIVPTVAVAAAFAEGDTHLTNIAQLRHKECDRLAAIASELGKMGVQTTCSEDSITIHGGSPAGAQINPHNDHRIAMSFAIAGLAVEGLAVEDEKCVGKSFPDFWQRLALFAEVSP